MSDEFKEFAEAIAAKKTAGEVVPRVKFSKVSVLGGGEDARLLAALCRANGAAVTLFSAYGAEIDSIESSGITIRGCGPVGTYQINQDNSHSIASTAEIDRAVTDAELIFLTGPIHKQRTYAMVLADHLNDGQVLVVPNAMTFAAFEIMRMLKVGGASADVTIVEMMGLPYWTKQEGGTLHLSDAGARCTATLPSGRPQVIEALSELIGDLSSRQSCLHSSMNDASAIVDYPILTMGGPTLESGGPEIVTGGVPLAENQTFRNLAGPGHLSVMRALSAERRQVAQRLGVRDLCDDGDWLVGFAGEKSGEEARPIPTQEEAKKRIRDLAIGSLSPLISLAECAGCPVPVSQSAMQMISAILGTDVSVSGRTLSSLGLKGDGDDGRRALEAAAKGEM